MQDKEIELKFVINAQIKNRLLTDLAKVATKVSQTRQIDTYYLPNFRDFEVNGQTQECLRLRETEKGIILTYKKVHREGTPVYCDEYETTVGDKAQLEKILLALGFTVQMVIDKVRLTYATKDFEFDFDTVKGLGELLEVELKSASGDLETIYNFVAKYGLTRNDVTYDGIQAMMKKVKNI